MMHEAYIGFVSTDAGAHFAPAIEENYTHPGLPGIQAPEGPGTYPGPLTMAGNVPIWSGTSPAVPSVAIGVLRGHQLVSHPVPSGGMPVFLQAIAFVTPRVGYVLTSQDRLLVTSDGGTSWHQVFPVQPSPTTAVSFLTPTLGYGLGTGGDPNLVLRTQNGGKTWAPVGTLPVTGGYSETPGALQFLNARSGFALNAQGQLLATQNGGKTWTIRPEKGTALAFFGRTGCLLTGAGAERTRDAGLTWQKVDSAAASAVACAAVTAYPVWKGWLQSEGSDHPLLGVVGSEAAWFAGGQFAQGIQRIADGGRQVTLWPPSTGWTALNARGYDFLTTRIAYCLSANGWLYRTDTGGQRWTFVG
jgi:photosystem II stability/assembly factor-like uncharacterized protein